MRRNLGLATAALTTVGLGLTTLGALGSVPAGASTTSSTASSSTSSSVAAAHRATRQLTSGQARAVAADAVAALAERPGLARRAAGQEFTAVRTLVDADGTTHTRLARTYRGLPVLGGDLVVHQSDADAVDAVSQTLARPLDLSTEPTVGASSAAARALRPSSLTAGIRGLVERGAPVLLVDATQGTPRLVWEVTTGGVQADGTPSRLRTYVDARTGATLRAVQGIHNVDGQGTGLYSGTVPLQLTQSGSSYQLKDPTRGGTYTVDVSNKTDGALCSVLGAGCATGAVLTSPDTSFGNGSTSSRESAAVDAQYGTNETWDYFKSTHGRDGIFGTGKGSYNRVHYGKNYVNAFWDGEKMTYGDGDGTSFGPLVSLDVAGHEMSHGVTENSANLTYSGESGGLNEATSDIFGTLVEFYAANSSDPGDYLIGEKFDLKNQRGFRRMDDPASDGKSVNCWTSGTGSLDVHYSSGVGNHFFYLLAEGSGSKTIGGVAHRSTTCDGSTVTGIGRDAAGAIWYRALTVYMTSGTDYHGARTATLNAARDLYGQGSTQYAGVASAWSAVGVS